MYSIPGETAPKGINRTFRYLILEQRKYGLLSNNLLGSDRTTAVDMEIVFPPAKRFVTYSIKTNYVICLLQAGNQNIKVYFLFPFGRPVFPEFHFKLL